MNNQSNITLTAALTLAIALTFSACGGDDSGNNGGNVSSKNSCINTELAVKANTLDDVAAACDASRGEVLSQLPNNIGSCNKNDLNFDKPIKDIATSCGVSEITTISSSSSLKASSSSRNNSSSSSRNNSSSSNVQQIGKIEGTPVTYQNKTYKTVVIGTQTWMAENLNYNASGSKCYDNLESNCNIYGRLYNWVTAMAVCPSGWHIPSNADWDKLMRYVDGSTGTSSPYDSPTAGTYLKATSGWNWNDFDDISGNGQDTYGFSALPGGYGFSDGGFLNVGILGDWWSASENDSHNAYYGYMVYLNEYAYYVNADKGRLQSVRCLKD